ncbi:MAG: cupin domain-containing protein [Desulfurococcales archaeon]|nr:cupin domain-containing protein [Desulfurococcales archaeon]
MEDIRIFKYKNLKNKKLDKFKLAARSLLDGETVWDGIFWEASEDKRKVYLSGSFEIGVATPVAPQDCHYHAESYEIIISLGKGRIVWRDGSQINSVDLDYGDIVIIPPLVSHKTMIYNNIFYFIKIPVNAKLEDDKIKIDDNECAS